MATKWNLICIGHLLHSKGDFTKDLKQVLKSWIRKLKSLILDEKYKKFYKKYEGLQCLANVFPMSAQCLPNICLMSAQFLPNISPMSAHCLPNVPNFCPMSSISAQCLPNVLKICPMSHMSAQCSQFLPNVVRGQISDFFRYVKVTFSFG